MNFVFIENRYKTFFWQAIARVLASQGHSIRWLVQNLKFMPSVGTVHAIPYPRGQTFPLANGDPLIRGVSQTDRQILYFGGSDRHYGYYAEQIAHHLEGLAPDVLIGEATLFHELIAVRWARRHGVPYLHPTSPGYPAGRFVVYDGDSKTARGGSGETVEDADCDTLIASIVHRKVVPEYMKKDGYTVGESRKRYPKPGSLSARLAMLDSYLRGERFNTPDPLSHVRLQIERKRCIRAWKQSECLSPEALSDGRYLLYPLQMQPEANLDVWGNRYRDQVAVIEDIANHLPSDMRLLVKTNPKVKYELSGSLLDLVARDPRIVPLPLDVSMGTVLPYVCGVVTVTGTVAIECMLMECPVIVLGPSVVAGMAGVIDGSRAVGLGGSMRALFSEKFIPAKQDDKCNLIRLLFAITYPGIVSDPCYMPGCIDECNARLVTQGLLQNLEAGL